MGEGIQGRGRRRWLLWPLTGMFYVVSCWGLPSPRFQFALKLSHHHHPRPPFIPPSGSRFGISDLSYIRYNPRPLSHLISFTTMYVISKSVSEDERRRLTGAKKTMSMETATLTVTNAQG